MMLLVLAGVPGGQAAMAADDKSPTDFRMTAAAKPPAMQIPGRVPDRIDFDFGDIQALLREDGSWAVEGAIAHSGMLCGQYRIGMRFGTGDRSCKNVEWLSPLRFVTSKQQCNNATMKHAGGMIEDALVENYAKINCAERVVRCTGRCAVPWQK